MMATVKISVALIMPWKYLRPRGAGLYVSVNILFLKEFSSMVLLATNIMEKMIKIAMFNQVPNLTPLYEEKSTIVS